MAKLREAVRGTSRGALPPMPILLRGFNEACSAATPFSYIGWLFSVVSQKNPKQTPPETMDGEPYPLLLCWARIYCPIIFHKQIDCNYT
jgi:hypothetical protein